MSPAARANTVGAKAARVDAPLADRTPARGRGDVIPRSVARAMTGIEWTDFSGNQWIGCTRVAAVAGALSGCDICYAASYAEQRLGMAWGPAAPRRFVAGFGPRMARLNRLAAATGLRFSVFTLSLGDWADTEVDPAWRRSLIETIEGCGSLNWLLLTHRPQLAKRLLPASWRITPPANVWPGVTIDHALHEFRWGKHVDYWGHTGRAWISAEPLVGRLSGERFDGLAGIVIGGASGTRDAGYAFDSRSVLDAVDTYGEERVFFKQHGSFLDGRHVGNKKAAGRLLQARTYDNTPWPRHREALSAARSAASPA